ncbi:NAD(+) diphosphatase [Andreprevotia chitinilytica]|uniref:NAD(+) diphosphatase n=1 Tax=Andreprevotia chitinilytica TaxID=396808 RepID=UPI00068EF131|nr:NAD(+) diphosphatase [Andreprevotia chitinilytica]
MKFLPTERFTPSFSAQAPSDAAHVLAFVGDDLLLTDGDALPHPAFLTALGQPECDYGIGDLAGVPCRLMAWPQGTAMPATLYTVPLRAAHGRIHDEFFLVAARAKQLLHWDRDHRFCGRCGTATRAAEHEAAKVCPACNNRMYPRVSPAIMVLIRRGDELLLGRSPHFKPGVYSALAGFVEPGETAEACVHREVMEEVGIKVDNLRWFASQSWPFPHSLMLAFTADYVSGEIVPQPGEIEDARWFRFDALPEMPSPASIARALIEAGVATLRDDAR